MRGLTGFRVAVVLLISVSGCQSGVYRQDAKLEKPVRDARVLLMPVDVELSRVTAAGLSEPKADWTDEARQYLTAAFRREEAGHGAAILDFAPESLPAERRDEARQLIKLHNAVGAEILDHQYATINSLPSKRGRFDWSLGPAAKHLKEATGADYALFSTVRDSYTGTARALLIAAAAAFTIPVLGGMQSGFASLVELETGNVVWFNRMERLTGNLRSQDAADEVAQTLLSDLPP
jgi:hypothetical protein